MNHYKKQHTAQLTKHCLHVPPKKILLQRRHFTFTFTFTCGEGDHKSGHPALRPLHGPSAQPNPRRYFMLQQIHGVDLSD